MIWKDDREAAMGYAAFISHMPMEKLKMEKKKINGECKFIIDKVVFCFFFKSTIIC